MVVGGTDPCCRNHTFQGKGINSAPQSFAYEGSCRIKLDFSVKQNTVGTDARQDWATGALNGRSGERFLHLSVSCPASSSSCESPRAIVGCRTSNASHGGRASHQSYANPVNRCGTRTARSWDMQGFREAR